MANKKITELTEITQPIGEDIFPIVHDPSGTPLNRKVSYLNLQNFVTVARSGGGSYICDGVADDVQINSAITYVSGLGGGTVFLKRGTYNTTAIISLASNVDLVGEGMGTIIYQTSGVNGDTIGGTSISYFSVRNLLINGNRIGNGSGDNGLLLIDSTDYIIERVRSTANQIKGFVTSGSCQRGTYIHCGGDDNGQDGIAFASGLIGSGKICKNIKVFDFYSHNNSQYGFGLVTPLSTFEQTEDISILYSHAKDNGTYGLEIKGAKAPKIIGNTIEGSGQSSPSTAIGIDIGSLSDAQFKVTGALIHGNTIKNQAGVNGLDSIGINLQSGDENIITNNKCFDDQTPKTQAYGFRYNSGDYNIITHNNFRGNLTSSVIGSPGGNNIYEKNQV